MRASRQDRRCRRRIPSGGEARPSGRHHHAASRGTSAPHSPDDGGNLGRKELDHYLPGAIHDHGAGSFLALVQRFSIQIAQAIKRWLVPLRLQHVIEVGSRNLFVAFDFPLHAQRACHAPASSARRTGKAAGHRPAALQRPGRAATARSTGRQADARPGRAGCGPATFLKCPRPSSKVR